MNSGGSDAGFSGDSILTTDLNMNLNRIINVANGINPQDVATVAQLGSGTLPDNSITNAKLVNKTVQNDKIADATIINSLMASNSIGTTNIIDANVTNAKLAGGITNDKILDSTIEEVKLNFTVPKGNSNIIFVSNNTEYINALDTLTNNKTILLQPGTYNYTGGAYNLTAENVHIIGYNDGYSNSYPVADNRNVVITHQFTVTSTSDLSSMHNISFNIASGNLTINNPARFYMSDVSVRDTLRLQNSSQWCIFDRVFALTFRIDDHASSSTIRLQNCYCNNFTNNLVGTSAPKLYFENCQLPFPLANQANIYYKGTISNRTDLTDFRIYGSSGKFYEDANVLDATNYLANGSITNALVGTDSITSDKIQNSTITTDKILNLAVTNDKLNGSITNDKLATAYAQLGALNVYTDSQRIVSPNSTSIMGFSVERSIDQMLLHSGIGGIQDGGSFGIFIGSNNKNAGNTYDNTKNIYIGDNMNGNVFIGTGSFAYGRITIGSSMNTADISVNKSFNMNNNTITNVPNPVANLEVANKQYVDGLTSVNILPGYTSGLPNEIKGLCHNGDIYVTNGNTNWVEENGSILYIRNLGFHGKNLFLNSPNSPTQGGPYMTFNTLGVEVFDIQAENYNNYISENTFFIRVNPLNNNIGSIFNMLDQDLGGFSQRYEIIGNGTNNDLFVFNGSTSTSLAQIVAGSFYNIIIRKLIYNTGLANEVALFIPYVNGVVQTSLVALKQINNNQNEIVMIRNVAHNVQVKCVGFIRRDITVSEVGALNTWMNTL